MQVPCQFSHRYVTSNEELPYRRYEGLVFVRSVQHGYDVVYWLGVPYSFRWGWTLCASHRLDQCLEKSTQGTQIRRNEADSPGSRKNSAEAECRLLETYFGGGTDSQIGQYD